MMSKALDSLLPLPIQIESSTVTVNSDKDFVFNKVIFDMDELSALQSIFNSSDSLNSKSASVKFMITIQDEADLQSLGYSKAQIDTFKPQEAEDLIQAGIKADDKLS